MMMAMMVNKYGSINDDDNDHDSTSKQQNMNLKTITAGHSWL